MPRSIRVREATPDDLDAVLAFLNSIGPARQFFPHYQPGEFFTPHATFKDLRPADLLLAFRNDRLVGTLAGWNQHRYRQSVVEGYSARLRLGRPFYNAWARFRGYPGLPKPGGSFRYLIGALPVVMNGDREVFECLLQNLMVRSANGPCDYLLIGLHESDPLLPTADSHRFQSYLTRIYLVCWEDGVQLRDQLDQRPIYMELGCL